MEGNRAYAAVAERSVSYRNIIFDLYGTLVDIHTDENKREAWKNMAALYGKYGAIYAPDELSEAYRGAIRDAQSRVSEINIENVFCRMYSDRGVAASAELLRDTCGKFRKWTTESIRLYDGARALLLELKRRGKRIYLLSNAQRVFTEKEMRQLGIMDCFDAVFLSSDYGVKKPEAEFFDILLNRTGIEPGESMMVGNDMSCDVGGAKRAGFFAFYIHSNLSPDYTEWKADDGCRMEENGNP